MGLNESYSQSINHIMMMLPTPSINKAYAMIISEESRRSLGSSSSSYSSEIAEGTALFSGKSNSRYALTIREIIPLTRAETKGVISNVIIVISQVTQKQFVTSYWISSRL